MKSFFLIFSALLFSAGLNAQPIGPKPFRLSGEFSNGPIGISMVYLSYMFEGERKLDSSSLSNGRYSFSGLVEEPVLGNLRVAYQPDSSGKVPATNSRRDIAKVFLQPGAISVTNIDSFSNVKVKGSKAHDAFVQLKDKLMPL